MVSIMIKLIVIFLLVEICGSKSAIPPDKSHLDEELIKLLVPKILSIKKPINFLHPQVSFNCQRDFLQYAKALSKFELWALKMLDASANLPAGILSGNVNSFGDFQECLSVISSTEASFKGKHCYVEMQPFVNKTVAPYIDHIRKYVQSFEIIQSRLEDPAHIFSRFSSLIYGICVPSSCTHQDVKEYAKFIIDDFIGNNTGLRVDVDVSEKMCHVAGDEVADAKMLNNGAKITIGVFAILVAFSLYSSYHDEINDGGNEPGVEMKDKSTQWIDAFSISRNYRKLISTKRNNEDIKAIHGIKFLNALLIFICHKTAESMIPSINRTEVALVSAQPSSNIVRICALYTDVFLMLSGVLVAYSITNRLMMKQKVSVLREYITRYIRIMPNIIVTMLLTGFIIPLIVPQTTQKALIIDKPAELCRSYGWRNLFMIQNWFQFEEMCNLHSHHIGTDFELFLLAPFLLMMLWKSPKKGFFVIISLGLASSALRFYVTYTKNLTYFVPFGVKLSTLIATANHLYTLPTHRFTVYGTGLLIGFIMRKERNFKVNNLSLLLGNGLSGIAVLIIHAACQRMIGMNVKYDVLMHASFAAFAPILACIPVAWVIFLSHNGYSNRFIRFLEWKGFLVTTRLCYAFYLIQIPIFQLLLANRRDVRYYNTSSVFDLNEIFVICVCSILMTIFIEMPVLNLKRIIFSEKKPTANGHVKMLSENNNEFKTK